MVVELHPRHGKIGVLVEVNCETDFVARNDDFQEFAREVALHVAAAGPLYVSEEEVPEEDRGGRAARLREQAAAEGKPEHVQEKIAEGRLRKWLEEVVLLNQKHVNEDKHGGKTIEELRAELAAEHRRERRDPALRALRGRRGVSPATDAPGAFKRILLKLSGEALMGDLDYGADPDAHRGDRRAGQARDRPRRRDRDRRRRRQHLPRPGGRRRRAWTAPPATTWACSPRC